MTIAELIQRLKQFPGEVRVVTAGFDESGYDDVLVSGPVNEFGEQCIVIDWTLHGKDAERERQAEHEAWVNSPEYEAMGELIANERAVAKAKRAARLATKNQEDPAWSAAIEANRLSKGLIP